MAKDERMIAALLRERNAYVARRLQHRVDQVDKQLHRLGYTPEVQEPEAEQPQGRTGTDPAQQTADTTPTPPSPVASEPVSDAAQETAAAAVPPAPVKKAAAPRRTKPKG